MLSVKDLPLRRNQCTRRRLSLVIGHNKKEIEFGCEMKKKIVNFQSIIKPERKNPDYTQVLVNDIIKSKDINIYNKLLFVLHGI